MKTIPFIIAFLLINIASFSQGYKIKVQVKNMPEQELILGYHFGKKQFVVDTAKLDSKGVGYFEDSEKLDRGMYFIAIPGKNYFDILLDDNQEFSIKNDTIDLVTNLNVKNSVVNEAFHKYQLFMKAQFAKASEYQKQLKTLPENTPEYSKAKQQLADLDSVVKSGINKMILDANGNLFAKLIQSTQQIEVPDPPKDENGEVTDKDFQFRYYKSHYFDNIDFSESGLIRTPFFEDKLMTYIEHMIIQIPDSVIPDIDFVLTKAQADPKMFQYVLSKIFNFYNSSKIMGIDKVFVHIAETYYISGKAHWADSSFVAELKEKVPKIKPNFIGNTAPDLKLETPNGEIVTLHSIDAEFTILVFWDPDCGHCKKEIPLIFDYYQEAHNKGVEVLAVYTQVEKDKWTEFIAEKGIEWKNVWDPYQLSNFRNLYNVFSTPIIYLLDKDKKIIAKRLSLEQTKEIIEDRLK